jgi:hypothetical protein
MVPIRLSDLRSPRLALPLLDVSAAADAASLREERTDLRETVNFVNFTCEKHRGSAAIAARFPCLPPSRMVRQRCRPLLAASQHVA